MTTTEQIIFGVNVGAGFGNLIFYAWGSHGPESLVIGIACLFAATWCVGWKR